jgi:hypothetical protein
MIIQNHIKGRRRVLDPAKKVRLCELVAQESYTVEQAADALDVSLRTVQRERKFDQDFDHEVRLALQQPPDPLKLMEQAARTHWRAAAWLLERRNPEEYARKPINTANPQQVRAALQFVIEAALRAVAPEQRVEVYHAIEAACNEAHDCCFPAFGPWGHPRRPKLPPTPLYDETSREATRIKYGLPLPTPEDLAAQARKAALREHLKQRLAENRRAEALGEPWPPASEASILSPEIDETTKCAATQFTTPPPETLAATPSGALPPKAASPPDILSPKTDETTKRNATECNAATKSPPPAPPLILKPIGTPPTEDDLERDADALEAAVLKQCPDSLHANDDFHHPDANDPRLRIQLYQERLDRHKRQERQKARAAEKKAKAMKRRAEAQRRRRAA